MSRIFNTIGSFVVDLTETLVIGLSLFLMVYLFLVQPHQVNGQSMVPNFQSGEYVLTDKLSYKMGQPKRGDVVVFHSPAAANCPTGTGCDFIKRVIGLPGETVAVKNNAIYINDQKLVESYIPQDFVISAGAYTKDGREIYLGEKEYFVSGDNRPYSSDSRAWGPIEKSDIVGKAFFVYWPIKSAGAIKPASY